jgi:hypothetical protein
VSFTTQKGIRQQPLWGEMGKAGNHLHKTSHRLKQHSLLRICYDNVRIFEKGDFKSLFSQTEMAGIHFKIASKLPHPWGKKHLRALFTYVHIQSDCHIIHDRLQIQENCTRKNL